MSRQARVTRQTEETAVEILIELDGNGDAKVDTGLGFFDHMLRLLAKHSLIDLTVAARGDLQVDGHHLVEDVGIALGRALREALGDGRGLTRYGWALVPMDEALAQAAVDLGGRAYLSYQVDLGPGRCGEFEPELALEFMRALANNAGLNLHLRLLSGGNTHHCLEACFKAVARALRAALALDPRQAGIPSTKGVLG
ncbi:MAG: imidazoleglycerol-phosphate dehydratase HisB [Bacteroidota bacterium]